VLNEKGDAHMPRAMTAAVVDSAGGPFVLDKVHLDDPRPDEVLVRIVAVGLCHTDLVMRDRRYPVRLPHVFGHEGAGVVVATGRDVSRPAVGQHVVLSYDYCGMCRWCATGQPSSCERGFRLNFGGRRADGTATIFRQGKRIGGHFFGQSSFAEYALANVRNTVVVPASAPLHQLGPLGCGISTGAGAVLNVLRPPAGTSVAVFGVGGVGMAAVLAAKAVGCDPIIAVDRNPDRVAFATELGASHGVDANLDEVVPQIRKITSGGADCSVDTTGDPDVAGPALSCLHHTGTCVMVGFAQHGSSLRFDATDLLAGRTVRGCVQGGSVPQIMIPRLVQMHSSGRFPFDRILTAFDFADIDAAASAAAEGRVVKPVLTFE
jgi:aryl-alcohol dehydrogenase